MEVYKFNPNSTAPCPDILQGKTEKEFLQSKFDSIIWYQELLHCGTYKLAGWLFNFNDVLKVYVVKQYDGWAEYRALSKTALRKAISGTILKIIEVK
jgi:hypothetical protein